MSEIRKQIEHIEAEVKKLEKMGGSLSNRLGTARDSAFERFPVVFVGLSSFGLVSTFYGFEKLIDQIPYFNEHPHMILVTGIVILVATGALYKKLS